MCCRPERLADVICAMREAGLEPKRLRTVHKTPSHAPWLFLIEGQKGAKPFLRIEPPLILRSGADLTEEAAKICHYGESYP
jgi:tRNA1(Val) A37 N6-methylase TrmN6